MGQHLVCAARKNGPCCRLADRPTSLPRLGDRGPSEGQRNAEAQGVDCVRIVHFMRNLLTRVPRSAQALVATLVRSIFAQPSAEEVWAQHARIVEQLAPRFREAVELLADAAPDILAFTAVPPAHWRQIWSNNPLERLNKEVRRRTDVVGIFPDRAAVLRLVGAVLAEQHDEWAVARCYLTVAGLTASGDVTEASPQLGAALAAE
jgi:hypothetical protein